MPYAPAHEHYFCSVTNSNSNCRSIRRTTYIYLNPFKAERYFPPPVAYIASIHEYGSPSNNIPPRPFFRPTVATQKKTWAGIGKQVLQNGGTVEDMLDLVGSRAAGDVFETISNIDSPPLALSTKKARNRKAHQQAAKYGKKPNAVSIKPLVDTKLLIHSISHIVVDKE